jgi:hypothetical protein
MEISPNCPNNYYFTFNIAMHADNDPQVWEYYLMIPAMAPKIVFQSCTIDDSDGNNDGALDPGESAGFLASLTNTGASDLGAFTANLFTNDPYITISDNGAFCDGIPVGQTVALNTPITIGVDPACPDPHEAVLTLSADADNGFFASVTVHVMVGGFSDDFEAGENGWVHYVVDSGFSDQWHQSETRNHSSAGTFSWKCGDAASGDYLNLLDAGLESPSIDVGENCVLRYWQWINSEVSSAYPGYAYDGGVVEISTDDGQSWQQISPVNDYTYLIRTGGTPGPFPAETPCFAGTSDWQEIEFDLNSYAEQAVKFRFRFGSDGAVSQEGWYIDDLRITSSTMYPAPVSLYAGLNNEDQALLAWAAPESGEPSGYNIYRSDQSGQYGSAPINESPVATTYFVDETCNMSHDNYYVVTAVYAGDAESHYSNEALLPQMYTGIEDDEKSLPTEFDLLQNYPNPFNPRTTIRYNLPEQAHVNITIYDILGRKVETLVNENRQAGYHQVTWDAAEHATGIYFYRIVAGDFSESYKMTMIK